jgi:hypothetical protein
MRCRFAAALALVGSELLQTQPVREELTRRIIELDSSIEEAVGESSQLRQNSPVLRAAVDGLLKAVAGWRIVAVHLAQLPHDQAQQQAAIVSQAVPNELRPGLESGDPMGWFRRVVGHASSSASGGAGCQKRMALWVSCGQFPDQLMDGVAAPRVGGAVIGLDQPRGFAAVPFVFGNRCAIRARESICGRAPSPSASGLRKTRQRES